MKWRNVQPLVLILSFIMILGATTVFAAEGDIFLKLGGALLYPANQVNVSLQARNDVRVNNNLYQMEVGGKKYDLTAASIAYSKNPLNWKELLTGSASGELGDNHSILNAANIETGKSLEAFISSGRNNYYLVEVEDSGKLEIEVNRYDDNNINLHFLIKDSNNTEKELLRNGSKTTHWGGNTSPDRTIKVDVEPGLYYIKTSANYRNNHVDIQGESGKYNLVVNYTKTKTLEDEEFNDTINSAIPIEFGESNSKTGHIMYMRNDGTRDETDYYKFKVLESGEVDIYLGRYDYSNVNLYLSILDKMGKEEVLYLSESTTTNNNERPYKSMILDLEPGEYYLKITTPYIYDYNYFEGDSGEYKLSVNHNKPKTKEDKEINDEIHQAIPIGITSDNDGYIMYTRNNGDLDIVDTYKIVVPRNGTLNINLERYGVTEANKNDEDNINLYLTKLNDMNKEVFVTGDFYDVYDICNNQDEGHDEHMAYKYNRKISISNLTPGEEYYIRVDTIYIKNHIFYEGKSGEYKLTLYFR